LYQESQNSRKENIRTKEKQKLLTLCSQVNVSDSGMHDSETGHKEED
jgi:hypothetical protein